MPSATIRITDKTYKILKEIKTTSGESMQSIIEKALENYKEKQFWNEVNQAFKSLKKSPDWSEELEERELWSNTTSDGM
jgi:predicted CopG family antitoxin